MKTTRYFTERVLLNHPEARDSARILAVLSWAIATEVQDDGRIRHWGWSLDENGKRRIMRVITLADGETVHNAFYDRSYERTLP